MFEDFCRLSLVSNTPIYCLFTDEICLRRKLQRNKQVLIFDLSIKPNSKWTVRGDVSADIQNKLIEGRTNRESREKSQRIVAQGYSHAYNPRIQQNRL